MVKEYREAEQKHVGYAQLRDSEVLRALVFLVRMAHGRTSGRPKSRAFVDFLLAQFPEKAIRNRRAGRSRQPDYYTVNRPRIPTRTLTDKARNQR